MPGSHASVFGDPDEFAAALRPAGFVDLLITAEGRFRARLTRLVLHRLQLVSADESLPRIAFVAVPAGMVLVAFSIGAAPSPIWGGAEARTDGIVGFGPRQRLHTRTAVPCRWGSILIPQTDLLDYGRALSGSELAAPAAARWRPPRASMRRLRHFHRAAIRMAEARSGSLADSDAAHGLEQQLIHAAVECLSAGTADPEAPPTGCARDLLGRFEDRLRDGASSPRIADICAALGVSQRVLRARCHEHLGMPPSRYLRLRKQVPCHSGSSLSLRRPDPRKFFVTY